MNYGFLILAGIVGIVVGIVIMMISSKAGLDKAKIEADSILEESKSKADTIVKQAQIDGQKAAFDLRQQADKEIKDRENKIQQMENRLNRDQDRLSVREENLTAKEKKLDEKGRLADAKLANISKMEADLQQKIDSQIEVLERTASLSQEDAKKELMDAVAKKSEKEISAYLHEQDEIAQSRAISLRQPFSATVRKRPLTVRFQL